MIEMRCPQCDHLLRAGDRFAGKSVGCKYCGTVFVAPLPNAPNPPMPIRGESRLRRRRFRDLGDAPAGPPPLPTPMPMVDDAPPAPDYASAQYPTPPVTSIRRDRASLIVPLIAVVLLWAVAAGVVYWRMVNPLGSAQATSPLDALHTFVRGLDDGDIALMRSASRFRDGEWTEALLRLMAANHGLEREFAARGAEPPVQIALPLGWSLPPAHEISPGAYEIEQTRNRATITFKGPLNGYDNVWLVQQGLYWYVDLRDFEPAGDERELARELMGNWQQIIADARGTLDEGHPNPARVQQALFATTLHDARLDGTVFGQIDQPPVPPLASTTGNAPLTPDDPLYTAVRRVVDAIHQGDQASLQGLVAPGSVVKLTSGVERPFWEIYTDTALEQMAQGEPPEISAIVPLDRGLSATTLRVTTTTQLGAANTRYTFRNQDGYWLLTRIAPESY